MCDLFNQQTPPLPLVMTHTLKHPLSDTNPESRRSSFTRHSSKPASQRQVARLSQSKTIQIAGSYSNTNSYSSSNSNAKFADGPVSTTVNTVAITHLSSQDFLESKSGVSSSPQVQMFLYFITNINILLIILGDFF